MLGPMNLVLEIAILVAAGKYLFGTIQAPHPTVRNFYDVIDRLHIVFRFGIAWAAHFRVIYLLVKLGVYWALTLLLPPTDAAP